MNTNPTPAASPWKRCTDEMPDSDETVLIHHPEASDPVWLGYHDGEDWCLVSGERIDVTHWMPMPAGPNEKLCEEGGK